MWTIEDADGEARVLTDGHEAVFITRDQEAELAGAATKGEFQDVLRKIMTMYDLPFDEIDLDSIRDAAAGIVSETSPPVVGHRDRP